MSSNPCDYMDYEGGDHLTADLGCMWLFGRKVKVSCARDLAYSLQAACLLCLWCKISDGPFPFNHKICDTANFVTFKALSPLHSTSKMTYIALGGALNSTHSLTAPPLVPNYTAWRQGMSTWMACPRLYKTGDMGESGPSSCGSPVQHSNQYQSDFI